MYGQTNSFSLKGDITVPKNRGNIYIYLLDKGHFDQPNTGLDTIIINTGKVILNYEFPNLPGGVYAIRCFQDVNMNGKLDRGIFGPTEPWAMSWMGEKSFPPRFEDISFQLRGDKRIDLVLSK